MKELLMLDKMKIDKKNPVPRYYQVKTKIKEVISLTSRKKGEKLPSERKLEEYFGVSRITIRKALDGLLAEGIIEKEWGKGIYIKKSISYVAEKTKRIGLTIWHGEEYSYHPASLEMMRGIGEAIEEENYGLEITFITSSMIKKHDYSERLNNNVDGIILTIQEIPEEDLDKIKEKIPCIIFVSRYNNISKTIMVDFKQAAYQTTKYLFELGHKKIALINGLEYFDISKQLFSGYKAFLEENGIEVNNNLVKNGIYNHQGGFNLTIEILKQEKPTALILSDDFMALGALDAIRKLGLRCPQDISICSFNDFPFARLTHPPLTTVKVPFYQLGKISAQNLISLIKGKKVKGKEILKGKLIVRGSTGVASKL